MSSQRQIVFIFLPSFLWRWGGFYAFSFAILPFVLLYLFLLPLKQAFFADNDLSSQLLRAKYFELDGSWLKAISPSSARQFSYESYKGSLKLNPPKKELWGIYTSLHRYYLHEKNDFNTSTYYAQLSLKNASYDWQQRMSRDGLRDIYCFRSIEAKNLPNSQEFREIMRCRFPTPNK